MTRRLADRPSRRFRRRTVRVAVAYAAPDGERCDPATTLGAGGIFIQTDAPLDEGSRLVLRFRLPGAAGAELSIAGRVVWCARPEDRPGHASGMGIEFTDREARLRLARALEHG